MIKKFVTVLILIIFSIRPAFAQETGSPGEDTQESFLSIEAGVSAPYTGYLFTPDALAKIYSDIEQREKSKELEFEAKLQSISLDITRMTSLHKVEIESRDLLLRRITDEKNEKIANLSSQVEAQKWFIAGAFVAGVLITGVTTYYISTVIK